MKSSIIEYFKNRMRGSPAKPRVARMPITVSTLQAYSRLRCDIYKPQPLHRALFMGRDEEAPLSMSTVSGNDFLNRFALDEDAPPRPVGVPPRLYWDEVFAEASIEPLEEAKGLPGKLYLETYDEYLRKNPLRPRPNHYHDEEVYANFGFLKINGHWADPDSHRTLHSALLGEAGLEFKLPGSSSTGPRIMEEHELDAYYDWLVEELHEGEDDEGDPRDMRISPETFRIWAADVEVADKFCAELIGPQPLWTAREKEELAHIGHKEDKGSQFDIETGSWFSGMYSPEKEPVMLLGNPGINMLQRPGAFSRMQPLLDHKFIEAFADENTPPSPLAGVSEPETRVFTTDVVDKAHEFDVDPEYGAKLIAWRIRRNAEMKEALHALEKEGSLAADEHLKYNSALDHNYRQLGMLRALNGDLSDVPQVKRPRPSAALRQLDSVGKKYADEMYLRKRLNDQVWQDARDARFEHYRTGEVKKQMMEEMGIKDEEEINAMLPVAEINPRMDMMANIRKRQEAAALAELAEREGTAATILQPKPAASAHRSSIADYAAKYAA